ncbi:hypothetical protein IT401_01680 [Candidatus Nomurabacteria bacterium]|nr:hypothetical protein [Candidatus Nomurabacteria bacterium]
MDISIFLRLNLVFASNHHVASGATKQSAEHLRIVPVRFPALSSLL